MEDELKQKIFNELSNSYNLSNTIDDLKIKHLLSDEEFLPIYNEWFFQQTFDDAKMLIKLNHIKI